MEDRTGGRGADPRLSEPGDAESSVLAADRRKATRDLQKSEGLLRAVVETAVDGIITIDTRGTITSLNPATERIFGYKAQELIGKNVRVLMPEPYHSEHDQYLANYMDTGVAKIIGIGREVQGLRKDGTVFPLELAVSETRIGDELVFTGIVRDITERKRAEEALRKSEGLLRAVVETAVDGIITIDERGTMETVNEAVQRIFGYEASELVGRNVRVLMPEPYHSEHDRYLSNYLETGHAKIIGIGREVQGRRKDGSTFPMELAVSETKLEGKRIFTGIVRDISSRKLHEQALRDSEERFRLLVEGVADYAIYMTDAEGRVASWNAGAERIFGYSAAEIMGESVSRFYMPQDVREGKPQREQRLAAQHGRAEEEGLRMRKDGSRFWAHVVLTALYSQDGKLRGFARFTRDITARRVAEEALRESAGLLRAVVETAVDGIITIDERGTIVSLNPATERIFGYEALELMGENVKTLMPEPYHGEHDRYLANYLQSGIPKIIGIGREVQGRRKDGSVFPLELAVSETKLEDKRIFTGIVRDITTRKAAEAAVQESARQVQRLNEQLEARVRARTSELEAANKELEGFTYSISHDLRAPLRSIVSTSTMLLREYGEQLDEQAAELLNRQAKAANRMAALIDDLLKYSRMARQELKRQPVDFTKLVSDVRDQVSGELGQPLDVDVEPGITLNADPQLVQLVVHNLLTNAAKFSRPEEPPRVRVGTCSAKGKRAVFFRDNGIGFEQRYAERLFLPFERLVRDDDYPGTGIGLANVKRIIERHGGRVWAEGSPGEGSTFYLSI